MHTFWRISTPFINNSKFRIEIGDEAYLPLIWANTPRGTLEWLIIKSFSRWSNTLTSLLTKKRHSAFSCNSRRFILHTSLSRMWVLHNSWHFLTQIPMKLRFSDTYDRCGETNLFFLKMIKFEFVMIVHYFV